MLLRLIRNSLAGGLIFFLCLAALSLMLRIPAAILLVYVGFAVFACCRLRGGWFVVFLLLCAFLIRFLYINIVNTPLISDFKALYDAAVLFSKGDYSFGQTPYFSTWGYQTGFVVYEGFVIELFGPSRSIYILKILNCLWDTGLTLLIYLMARNYFKEISARLVSILYMGLVFPVTFVSVLSNQHISSFLIVSGIFLLTDKRIIKAGLLFRALLGGFFIALGNIMRPEGLIILTSVLVYFLILFIRAAGKRKLNVAISALVLIGIFASVNTAASRMIIDSGINPSGLANNNFYWKFVVGLNYESNGTYNTADIDLVYKSALSKSELEDLEIKIIKERLSIGPLKLGKLFINKIQILWCDDAMFWSYFHLLDSGAKVDILGSQVDFREIDSILKGLQRMSNLFMVILCLAGLFYQRKSGHDDSLVVYIAVLFISFAVYLLIEVQPRYIYLQEIFLFVLGGMGFDALSDKFGISGMGTALKKLIAFKSREETKQGRSQTGS